MVNDKTMGNLENPHEVSHQSTPSDNVDRTNGSGENPRTPADLTTEILTIGKDTEFLGGVPDIQNQKERQQYEAITNAVIQAYGPESNLEENDLKLLFQRIFLKKSLHIHAVSGLEFSTMLNDELQNWTTKLEGVNFDSLKMFSTHTVQALVTNGLSGDKPLDPNNIFGVLLAEAH